MPFEFGRDRFSADAGMDTSKLKEWVFTKMPVTDKEGKSIKVDILLQGLMLNR